MSRCLASLLQHLPVKPNVSTSCSVMKANSNRTQALGYSQWMSVRIVNHYYRYNEPYHPNTHSIQIKNVSLSYGKFYEDEWDKDSEIPVSRIENSVVKFGDELLICSCGRSGSPSGTTGSFSLFDMTSGTKICTFEWNCPWASYTNSAVLTVSDPSWSAVAKGFKTYGNALEHGEIECYYKSKGK